MSDYESNYRDIGCPFCDANVSNHDLGIDMLGDEQDDFFQCPECDKFFKVTLQVFKSYDYIVETPTEKEVESNSLSTNKDPNIFEDVVGQNFMWDNLFPYKS